MTLADLLEQTKEGGELLRDARERARPACIAAVRKLEAALVEALGGEKLRGLPVLWPDPMQGNPTGAERYNAARARGKKNIERVLSEAKPVLVVSEDGHLKMAVAFAAPNEDVGPVERPVEDAELLAEDVEDVASAVEEVLRRHLVSLGQRTGRYQRFLDLA